MSVWFIYLSKWNFQNVRRKVIVVLAETSKIPRKSYKLKILWVYSKCVGLNPDQEYIITLSLGCHTILENTETLKGLESAFCL